MANTILEINKRLSEVKTRSAWSKGVILYAEELLESYAERADYEGRQAVDIAEFKEWLLNVASDWNQYSCGGSSLICDLDIAERLCTPSEFKRCKGGERKPNANEDWLDTQARALNQAAQKLIFIAKLYI